METLVLPEGEIRGNPSSDGGCTEEATYSEAELLLPDDDYCKSTPPSASSSTTTLVPLIFPEEPRISVVDLRNPTFAQGQNGLLTEKQLAAYEKWRSKNHVD